MSTIEVNDIGPVRSLSIPIPEDGGVVVLRGRNGRGKSHVLAAVDSLVTGRDRPVVRDGARQGSIRGLGAAITVARNARRSGELLVESLDGRVNVVDLVDPGLKSPEAADAKRIKALVGLRGVQPDRRLFFDLVGGEEDFERLIGSTAVESDDLVLMAERIKRDLEAAARRSESAANISEGHARGAREASEGIDMAAESDRDKLSSAMEAAVRVHAGIKQRVDDATKMARVIADARAEREAITKSWTGPSVESATAAEAEAQEAVTSCRNAVYAAETALQVAKQKFAAAQSATEQAIVVRQQAMSNAATLEQLDKTLAVVVPARPSDEDIAAAVQAVAHAKEAVERGSVIRRAKEAHAKAAAYDTEAADFRAEADRLRAAARGTDDVLSSVAIPPGCPLRVEAGRLVLDTSRGVTPFNELSAGERWVVALDIAIDALGTGGLLTIPQEAWEGLDAINRDGIASHVRSRGVVLLTAESGDDDDVTANVYEASSLV